LAKVSPARKIAFEILLKIDAGEGFADELLRRSEVSDLSERDRALATEIVMGVLRWRGEIDDRLERLSGKAIGSLDREVITALRMGIYQIVFLERIPKSAAVNESVELTKLARKRSAAGLVNAVLRKCEPVGFPLRHGADVLNDVEFSAAVGRTLPPWLLERWESNFGAEAANRLAWMGTQVPATTLRITSCTPEPDEVIGKLEEKGFKVRRGRYARQALIVESGEAAAARIAEELGLAVQDEASQLVAELVGVRAGDRVLDVCAAPGMKTSLLADAVGEGLIVACDPSARRLRTMRKLLPRLTQNAKAVRPVRLDATEQLPFNRQFDRILVDAPCSGTGTLARNPEIKWRLAPEDLPRLAAIQSKILANALAALAPGGRLVYATCSLEPEENEIVVERVLASAAGFRRLGREELVKSFPKLGPLIDENGYFRTRPDLHGMDGFFAAAITRQVVLNPQGLSDISAIGEDSKSVRKTGQRRCATNTSSDFANIGAKHLEKEDIMYLKGKKIAVLVADQYQELEVWYPLLRFREDGAETVAVGAAAGKTYESKKGYPIVADKSVGDVSAADFDAVVIPGGWAPDFLRQDERMVRLVRDMFNAGKVVAAICHGGWLLCSADVVRGRKATCFTAIKDDMIHAGAKYVDEEVAVDGNLITSRKPTDLPAFCQEIARALSAQPVAQRAGKA